MQELLVTSWQRFGHDRLYVNLPDGTSIGWADRATGEITLVHPSYRDAVMDALARREPSMVQEEPEPVSRPSLPALTPEYDLASKPPGAALRAKLAAAGPGPGARVLAKVFNRSPEWEPWSKELAGERRVAAELRRLARHGWRVLHSIPLPDEADIDHLLIGPGGVFTVATHHHRDQMVSVGDDTITIDNGKPQPHDFKSRATAKRAQLVLEDHCDFDVPVQAMLVYVGVAGLDVVATQLGARVYQERQVAALAPLSGVLDARQVEKVYTVARDRRLWFGA